MSKVAIYLAGNFIIDTKGIEWLAVATVIMLCVNTLLWR